MMMMMTMMNMIHWNWDCSIFRLTDIVVGTSPQWQLQSSQDSNMFKHLSMLYRAIDIRKSWHEDDRPYLTGPPKVEISQLYKWRQWCPTGLTHAHRLDPCPLHQLCQGKRCEDFHWAKMEDVLGRLRSSRTLRYSESTIGLHMGSYMDHIWLMGISNPDPWYMFLHVGDVGVKYP